MRTRSAVTRPSRPSSSACLAYRIAGIVRRGKEMQKRTSLRTTASAMARQSATVVASTFSVKMCLPASAVFTITCRCRLVGVATHTASTSSLAKSASKPASNGTSSSAAQAAPAHGILVPYRAHIGGCVGANLASVLVRVDMPAAQ